MPIRGDGDRYWSNYRGERTNYAAGGGGGGSETTNNSHSYKNNHRSLSTVAQRSRTGAPPFMRNKMRYSGYNNSGRFNNSNDNSSNDNGVAVPDTEEQCSSSTAILSAKQVARLRSVLGAEFEVCGRGNFPTLKVRLVELVTKVRQTLRRRGIAVSAAKMNGGAASYILAARGDFSFSDLDLIFNVRLVDAVAYERVKDAVLAAIADLLPDGCNRAKIDSATVKDAYIRKMVKVVTDDDRWSLFSLNNYYGNKRAIELKFVDQMRRQFEFSVDSFQICLDPLLDEQEQLQRRLLPPPLTIRKCVLDPSRLDPVVEEEEEEELEGEASSCTESSSDDFSLTTTASLSSSMIATSINSSSVVDTEDGERQDHNLKSKAEAHLEIVAESKYGDIRTALRHLNDRLIDTKKPEQIRGGGLMKYCHLLVRGYRPARLWKYRHQERYMCSRFFIDFPDISSQEIKLRNYLDNHLADDDGIKYDYLSLLYRVVSESTVCLMWHERRQTLSMIDRLIYQLSVNIYYQQHRCEPFGVCGHQPKQTLLYLPRNATYWIPVV